MSEKPAGKERKRLQAHSIKARTTKCHFAALQNVQYQGLLQSREIFWSPRKGGEALRAPTQTQPHDGNSVYGTCPCAQIYTHTQARRGTGYQMT